MKGPSVRAILSVAVLAIAFSLDVTNAEQSAASRGLLYNRQIKTGAGTPGYGSLQGDTATQEYKDDRLASNSIYGIAFGFTVMSLGVIWAIFNCMGKCGKGGCQTPCLQNLCCTGPADPKGYTKTKRTMMGVWLILCFLIMMGCAIAYADGAGIMYDGIQAVIGNMKSSCEDNKALATKATGWLKDLGIPVKTSLDASVGTVCQALADAKADTSMALPVWIYVVWVAACLVPLVGILAWCTGKGSVSVAVVVLSWITMMLLWFCFGSVSAQAAWLDDTCMQLQNL
jgi:hypothetical protein